MCFDLNGAEEIGVGGEARVVALDGMPLAAKIPHAITDRQRQKLVVMRRQTPRDFVSAELLGHLDLAWPTDLLLDVPRDSVADGAEWEKRVVGFVMPLVPYRRRLVDFYNPASRRELLPGFDYRYLHRTARNLAAALAKLHAHGVIVGDLNESNILGGPSAMITLVDVDSYQIHDRATATVFPCPVGRADYTAPELLTVDGHVIAGERTPAHDAFGLAVLIFQLLMEGTHPFAGRYMGPGDPPPLPERIRMGMFPYRLGGHEPTVILPMPAAPPIEWLSPDVRDLFRRAFIVGARNPALRPMPLEWRDTLDEAEHALQACPINPQHKFGRHLGACPWCERTAMLGGRDPFPAVSRYAAAPPPPPPPLEFLPPPSRPRRSRKTHVGRKSAHPTAAPPPPRPSWAAARAGLATMQVGLGFAIAYLALNLLAPNGLNGVLVAFAAIGACVLQFVALAICSNALRNSANPWAGRSLYCMGCGCLVPLTVVTAPLSAVAFLVFLKKLVGRDFLGNGLIGFAYLFLGITILGFAIATPNSVIPAGIGYFAIEIFAIERARFLLTQKNRHP